MHTRFVIVSYFSIKRRHIWYYNRSFDVCVSGVRSGAVSCERVRVSCEWASRRSSVVRREAFSFALCVVWDSEVFVSNFEFEFLFRICRRNFRFEFRVQVPWIFVSNLSSNFEFEFFVSSLYSISRIWLWIRRRIRLLECRVEFQIRMRRRNFSSKFSMSCSIRLLEIDRQIRLLEVRCSIRLLEFRVFDSTSRFKSLEFDDSKLSSNFEFVLIYSTSRTPIRKFRWSSQVLEVAFFIWVLNWTIQFSSKFWFTSPTFVLNCHLTSSIILARALSLRSRCHASFARAFRA